MMDPRTAELMREVVDASPHHAADRQWWWSIAGDLQRDGFLVVKIAGRRGPVLAHLAWTQRGRAALDVLARGGA